MFPTFLANYTAFLATWTILPLLALWLPTGNPVSPILTVVWLGGLGWRVGRRLLPQQPAAWRWLLGMLVSAAMAIGVAAVVYYFYRLDRPALSAVLLLTTALLWLLQPNRLWGNRLTTEASSSSTVIAPPNSRISSILALLTVGLIAYAAGALSASATNVAVRSPWDVAPSGSLLLIFLIALAVVTLALNSSSGWSLWPSAGLAWLMVSVATLTYATGFGFDPFIHQATESAILRDGFILPKTAYYLGQYATVTLVAQLAKISVQTVDVWLVPLSFALVPPVAFFCLRRSQLVDRPLAGVLAVLLLPLSSLAMTTPQGFANVLVLLAAFLTLAFWSGRLSWFWPALVAALAVLTHPIAGLPTLVFLGLVAVAKTYWRSWQRRLTLGALVAVGSLALPIAFLVGSPATGDSGTASLISQLPTLLGQLLLAVARPDRRFLLQLDFTYLWQSWQPLLLLMAAVGGSWRLHRAGHRGLIGWWLAVAICLVNWLLLKSTVNFPFLIDYERSNYADRLLDLSWLLLVPLIAVGLGSLLQSLRQTGSRTRLVFVILVAAAITANCYLIYPRRDSYESSRGWSTGAADVAAVRLIDEDAGARPYVVLANQSVSAAAIREFGFRTYYQSAVTEHKDIFYYPIPTGGPLYDIFLKANERLGSLTVVNEALELTGADLAYLVVNDYWWDARRIVAGAKREAVDFWSVQDRTYVFRYEKRRQ